jgi:hypothetical protein
MKKIVKYIIFSILTIGLIIGLFVTITIYPELILRYKLEHKNYKVNSSELIDKKMIDDTFMSINIKQNDILHEMFTWSETYIKL